MSGLRGMEREGYEAPGKFGGRAVRDSERLGGVELIGAGGARVLLDGGGERRGAWGLRFTAGAVAEWLRQKLS